VTDLNHIADAADDVLRRSRDAKAIVTVGPFARGGKSRRQVEAADHDFQPLATVTPVGICLPTLDELCVYGVTSKVTSDWLGDRLAQWWEAVRERFAPITTLVIKVDNGPENHSRRTQWMQRMVQFVQQYRVPVRLAYDPPSHSKSNPIERCWVMCLHPADKYHRLTHRPSQGQKGLDERALMASQWPSEPWGSPRSEPCGRTSPAQAPPGCFRPPRLAHRPAGCGHGGTRNSNTSRSVHTRSVNPAAIAGV
jgi:Rhodopirellula transposase DDE domain